EKIKRVESVDAIEKSGTSVHIGKMMPKLFSQAATQEKPDVLQRMRRIMEECPQATMVHGILAIMSRRDHMLALRTFEMPLLILVGSEDPITPPELSREMQRVQPNAKLEELKGCAHMACLERPEHFNAALEKFAREVYAD